MTEIILDVTTWRGERDFYDALLPALGASDWHGHDLDALNDTLGGDDINAVWLPIRLTIVNAGDVPAELGNYLAAFADLIIDLSVLRGCDIRLTLD